MTRNNITEAAKQFYFACENGTGWTNCQPYCHLDATFSSEAKTLREIDNLITTPNGWRKFTII